LKLAAVTPEIDPPALPLTFAISMGVRKGNTQLQEEVQRILITRKPEIERLLLSYGVPQISSKTESAKAGAGK
jgi:hypothetical protein